MKICFRKKKQERLKDVREVFEVNDIDNFIYKWNNDYPIDRWYRQKYGIAFGSPEHRVLSFIDMYIDWKEDRIYRDLFKEKEEYKKGDWLKPQSEKRQEKVSDEELMEAFNNPDVQIG